MHSEKSREMHRASRMHSYADYVDLDVRRPQVDYLVPYDRAHVISRRLEEYPSTERETVLSFDFIRQLYADL